MKTSKNCIILNWIYSHGLVKLFQCIIILRRIYENDLLLALNGKWNNNKISVLLDLLCVVPTVCWMKSAAFSQYSCWLPNVGHSPFFISPNKAMNWTKAISSFFPHVTATLFTGEINCFGLFGDRTNLAFWRSRWLVYETKKKLRKLTYFTTRKIKQHQD